MPWFSVIGLGTELLTDKASSPIGLVEISMNGDYRQPIAQHDRLVWSSPSWWATSFPDN